MFKKKNIEKVENKNLLVNPKRGLKKVLGVLALVVVTIAFVTSCEKKCKVGEEYQNGSCVDTTTHVNPHEALLREITQLEKDSIAATNNCRTARDEALYNPADISEGWSSRFDAGGFKANDLKDSLNRDEIIIDYFYSFGDPLPTNDATVKAYKGSIFTWKQVVAMLTDKRTELK